MTINIIFIIVKEKFQVQDYDLNLQRTLVSTGFYALAYSIFKVRPQIAFCLYPSFKAYLTQKALIKEKYVPFYLKSLTATCFPTHLLEKGYDIGTIQELLDHKDLQTK